jgi:hypothetical protein
LTTLHHTEDAGLTWRKAKRSNAGNDCVEVARTSVSYVIRDSNNPTGPWLSLDAPTWAALIGDVKDGKYWL